MSEVSGMYHPGVVGGALRKGLQSALVPGGGCTFPEPRAVDRSP